MTNGANDSGPHQSEQNQWGVAASPATTNGIVTAAHRSAHCASSEQPQGLQKNPAMKKGPQKKYDIIYNALRIPHSTRRRNGTRLQQQRDVLGNFLLSLSTNHYFVMPYAPNLTVGFGGSEWGVFPNNIGIQAFRQNGKNKKQIVITKNEHRSYLE